MTKTSPPTNPYELGQNYAIWKPGQSFEFVVSVALTLHTVENMIERYGATGVVIKFVSGYNSVCPIGGANERLARLSKGDYTAMTTAAEKREAAKNARPVTPSSKNHEENTTGYINSVTFSGTLGRDTELQFIPSGQEIAKNGLAVFNPGGKTDKEKTKWMDLECWLQETDTPKFKNNKELYDRFVEMEKGAKVVVTGSLKFRYWVDKTGKEHETVSITVKDIG